MYNKLFKIVVLPIVLSLSFFTLSCKSNDNDNSNNKNKNNTSDDLLSGIVNFSGSYYGKVDTRQYETLSFETGNGFKSIIFTYEEDNDTSDLTERIESFYKIAEVTRIGSTDDYRVQTELKSVKLTIYKDELITKVNKNKHLGYTDWQSGVTKEVISSIKDTEQLFPARTFTIPKDKNSITLTGKVGTETGSSTYTYRP